MTAILIRVKDAHAQAYVQQHPCLQGPDWDLNRRLREEWLEAVELRKPPATDFAHDIVDVPLRDLVDERAWEGIRRVCRELDLPPHSDRSIVQYFAWKIARGPRTAKRILAIGCAGGHELVPLRALYPEAEISGVDYNIHVPKEWRSKLDIKDLSGSPFDAYLEKHPGEFDLVYSNSTLEHMFEPDRTLRLIRAALVDGGRLVSSLPMEGDSSNPFYDEVVAIASRARPFDRDLDLEFVSTSHVWKTNREDLAATLSDCGFGDVRMISRTNYPSGARNHDPMPAEEFAPLAARAKTLEAMTLGPLRKALRTVFPKRMPEPVIRAYYALAGRCWFSRLRMLHLLLHEVAFVATAR